MLRFEDVSKSFAGTWVLQHVDISVHHRETMVILGRSGSGKSVMLKHVNGLLRPDGGRVFVGREKINDLNEAQLRTVRARVAMLFQGGALFDSMNVFENVAFALRQHTELAEDEIIRTVRQKLAMVDLEGVEHLMPSKLSGGMKKRVALARAIALDPEVILYDEPTTGLDPIVSAKINHLIRQLQRKLGVTSVVVTHDISSAMFVGDRIALLHHGRIEFVGSVAEAKINPSRPLRNFLDGIEEFSSDER